MLRHRLSGDRHALAQVRDRERALLAEALEERPAGGVGDGDEDRVHAAKYMQPGGCASSLSGAHDCVSGGSAGRHVDARIGQWPERT